MTVFAKNNLNCYEMENSSVLLFISGDFLLRSSNDTFGPIMSQVRCYIRIL